MGLIRGRPGWVSDITASAYENFAWLTRHLMNRFRTAWLSAWEKEPCEDIFGKMEVTGKDLPSVAEGIVAASSK